MRTRQATDILVALLAVLAFGCFVAGLAGVVSLPGELAAFDVVMRILPAAGALLLLAALIGWSRGAHR